MTTPQPDQPVLQLRVTITASDFDQLTKFYCEGLGLKPVEAWDNWQGQAVIVEAGRATLEIFDETQAQTIDQIEAGRRISGPIRFALQVPDLNAALERLLAHGATLIHPPVDTPWGDRNVRLQTPDGLQITLFQVMSTSTE